jgi:hypothetical protein
MSRELSLFIGTFTTLLADGYWATHWSVSSK